MEKENFELVGKIRMNADGIRKIADSLDFVYGHETIINLPVWRNKDYPERNLIFQLERDSGEVDLVLIERDDS